MKVVVTAVGFKTRSSDITWPKDWPIPRVGDDVDIPNFPEVSSVRTVVWYPIGNEDDPEPFVYLVLGPRRP